MPTKSKKKKQESNNTAPHQMAQATISDVTGQAVRTGVKLQEEAGQWWTRVLAQLATAGDWQRHLTSYTRITADAMPLTQRRVEEFMSWVERSGRGHAEVFRKALQAAQTTSVAESPNKWMEVWTASMKAAQSDVESATQISTNALDSWIACIRKNIEAAKAPRPKVT